MAGTARSVGSLGFVLALAVVLGMTAASAGWGTAQAQTAPTLEPPDAPGAPALTAHQGRIVMSWSQPAHHGGGPIFRYDIRWTVRDAGWDAGTQVSWFGALNRLRHTIWGLAGDTEYEVQVRAVNVTTYDRGGADNDNQDAVPHHYQLEGDWSPSAYATVPAAPEPESESESEPAPTLVLIPVYDPVTGKLLGYQMEETDPEGKGGFDDCENFEQCNSPGYVVVPERLPLVPPDEHTECSFQLIDVRDQEGKLTGERAYIVECSVPGDPKAGIPPQPKGTLDCSFVVGPTERVDEDGNVVRAYFVACEVDPDPEPLPYRCLYDGRGDVVACSGTPPAPVPVHERSFCFDDDGNPSVNRDGDLTWGCMGDPDNYYAKGHPLEGKVRGEDGEWREPTGAEGEEAPFGVHEPKGKENAKTCKGGALCNDPDSPEYWEINPDTWNNPDNPDNPDS